MFHPLPPRPRPLTRDELQRVFGGCNTSGQSCQSSKDCCAYHYCETGKCAKGTPYWPR